ncbi:hypothetical protein JMJ58_19195 [Haloterrigena salifodinae]|uniref:Uncharacterized protein n=1 Tax=Haloterrigena salifodinae TaxID=2675099 RepID=A0A8T8DZU3_9EURY|nr:hypothetical protein [Haloterrigena salifodinae]QRV15009.1 hypothetical protein JMJ58_19195 [Haloterrigena salifodinae]
MRQEHLRPLRDPPIGQVLQASDGVPPSASVGQFLFDILFVFIEGTDVLVESDAANSVAPEPFEDWVEPGIQPPPSVLNPIVVTIQQEAREHERRKKTPY